jgi:hypothetical protein
MEEWDQRRRKIVSVVLPLSLFGEIEIRKRMSGYVHIKTRRACPQISLIGVHRLQLDIWVPSLPSRYYRYPR